MKHIFETFQDWMSKLKSDISDNKRLKANNLRKILNSVTDYTNDVIGLQLLDFPMPDTNRAAEGNIQDVGRIIQVGLHLPTRVHGSLVEGDMPLDIHGYPLRRLTKFRLFSD